MIAAVTTVLNEIDIIDYTLEHLLNEGVDRIYVVDGGSADGTLELLYSLDGPVEVLERPQDGPFAQAEVMTSLAAMAGEDGADWIVPFDADEFWCDIPILLEQPDEVVKVFGRMYQYWSPILREPGWKPLPKVAFRYQPGVKVAQGNHDVSITGTTASGLTVREWQYRGPAHFIAKLKLNWQTMDRTLGPTQAAHYLMYEGWTDPQLRDEYERLAARGTIFDPIPILEEYARG